MQKFIKDDNVDEVFSTLIKFFLLKFFRPLVDFSSLWLSRIGLILTKGSLSSDRLSLFCDMISQSEPLSKKINLKFYQTINLRLTLSIGKKLKTLKIYRYFSDRHEDQR